MGIFGTSDEIIREEETNVGNRLQARTGFQKSMNWLMGVDQYGNQRSKAQRTVASSLKILAAAGATAATGGLASPLLAAAIGGATLAGVSYGAGQSVKNRARGTSGAAGTISDVKNTQRKDYVNAALYTATAGTAGVYKQGLQKQAEAANKARIFKLESKLAEEALTAAKATGTKPVSTDFYSQAAKQVGENVPKVTYMDALRQAPKDFAKFEKNMKGKLGDYGYKKAKEYAIKGAEKGIKSLRKKRTAPYNLETEEYEGDYMPARDAQGNVYKKRIK